LASSKALPDSLAFEIVRRADLLASFPEMGASLQTHDGLLSSIASLIVSGKHRVIYRLDEERKVVYILAYSTAGQQLRSSADLLRAERKSLSEENSSAERQLALSGTQFFPIRLIEAGPIPS